MIFLFEQKIFELIGILFFTKVMSLLIEAFLSSFSDQFLALLKLHLTTKGTTMNENKSVDTENIQGEEKEKKELE